MKYLLLLVILHGGEVRYKIEEFPSMKECREFRDMVPDILPAQARIVRNECFEVGTGA